MHEIIFELKNVSFAYKNEKPIFQDLSLSVKQGRLVAIAGPNGSGKTTLIKLFNGLHSPSEGSILFKGRPVKKHNHLTEHVGIVFQNPDEQVFFPKVEEDIAFGLRNLSVPEDEITRRVENVLTTLKIEKLKGRNFFQLSFGEKKKVAFAGVMVTTPDVIVLDEPTIGLDPWSRKQFIELILEMKKHSTVIVVSHDFDVLRIVDEIKFLWEGKIIGEFKTLEDFQKNMYSVDPNGEKIEEIVEVK